MTNKNICKTIIKGTPESGLQTQVFENKEIEAATELHRISEGRREMCKMEL